MDVHVCTLATLRLLLLFASIQGTLIRIFDTASGSALQELRRGADRAEIYSICFNPSSAWLAVSSDKATIHIFSLKASKASNASSAMDVNQNSAIVDKPNGQIVDEKASNGSAAASSSSASSSSAVTKKQANPTSSFSFMKNLLPKYFSSEWSFAQFRVPDGRTIVAFGQDKNSIIVVSADGTFYKALFDPDKSGGECVQESYAKFIKAPEEVQQ